MDHSAPTAVPFSPSASGLEQRSGAPYRTPSLPALHDHSPPLLHSNAVPSASSSIGRQAVQPPRRFPTLVGSTPSKPSCSAGAPDPKTSASRQRNHWDREDDNIIIASIREHGNKWVKAQKAIAEAGRPQRTALAIEGRYRFLLTVAAKQPCNAKDKLVAPASNSAIQPLDVATALAAASSMLHNRTLQQKFQPWTRQEIEKLSSIGGSMPWKDVFSAFLTAFPLTTRTEPAVVARWHRLHHRGKTNTRETRSGRGSRPGGDGQGLEEEQQGSTLLAAEPSPTSSWTSPVMKPEGPRTSPLPSMATTSREDASTALANETEVRPASGSPKSVFTTNPLLFEPMDELETMKPSYLQNAEGGSASGAGMAAPRGPSVQFAAHTSAPLWPHTSRAHNYTIDLHANGFVVTNLPPGHQVRILSPTQCRVSVSAQLLCQKAPGHDEESQQQQQQQRCGLLHEAPFAFQVRADGAIEAINFPRGTATSICLVRAGVGDARGEAKAGDDDGRLVSQTSFVGKDGFSVVFESEVA